MMKTFAERLLQVIGQVAPTPWGIERGISPSTMDGLLNKGSTPYPKTIDKLVAGTGIPAEWWKSGEGAPPTPDPALMSVRLSGSQVMAQSQEQAPPRLQVSDVAGNAADTYQAWASGINMDDFVPIRYYRSVAVSSGGGALNHDHEPDALLFSRRFVAAALHSSPESLLLVRVKGDSMIPTLQAGWTVMVDTSRRSITSGIYVVRVGEMEFCKRLEARPGGLVKVISDNRLYEEYDIDLTTLGDGEFHVIGEVVWFAGLLK